MLRLAFLYLNSETLMKQEDLTDRHCVPCSAIGHALPQSEVKNLLKQLQSGWTLNTSGHLHKEYRFKNFKKAMEFANAVTEIAEKDKHHPDLHVAWGRCGVELWTHAISGLSENDFIMAAKIEQAFARL